jgi:sugar phosphate permease
MNSAARRELVFGIFCLLFILALFLRTSTAVIVEDLMADFAIPAAALGLMASAIFYAYSMSQLPVGMLSDHIGVRSTVAIFGLLGAAGSLLFAFSPGIQMATWARVLTGVGTAGIWVPALKYLSLAYQPEEFATRTSIVSTVGSLGLLIATLPLAMLVERVGWRFPFILAGSVLLVLIIIAWLLMGGRSASKRKTKAADKAEDKSAGGVSQNHTPFWRHPIFWRFALWAFLIYGVQFSFQGLWGAVYLQNAYGISREIAGSHLLFTSLGVLIGGVFWGLLSDRYFRARRPVLLIGTLGMLGTWIIMASLSSYPGSFFTSLIYFFLGIFGIVFLINFSCVKEIFPVEKAGMAIGAINTFMLLGTGVYQGVTGYMIDYFLKNGNALTAYRAIFYLYLGSIIVAFCLVLIMPETYHHRKQSRQLPDQAGLKS